MEARTNDWRRTTEIPAAKNAGYNSYLTNHQVFNISRVQTSGCLRSVEGQSPDTSFYPCWQITRHPIKNSRTGDEARMEQPHLQFGSQLGDPHQKRAAHTRKEQEPQRCRQHRGQGVRRQAPAGRRPRSRYCQRATKSLRANATMPMRRRRLFPWAKRF